MPQTITILLIFITAFSFAQSQSGKSFNQVNQGSDTLQSHQSLPKFLTSIILLSFKGDSENLKCADFIKLYLVNLGAKEVMSCRYEFDFLKLKP